MNGIDTLENLFLWMDQIIKCRAQQEDPSGALAGEMDAYTELHEAIAKIRHTKPLPTF